MINNPNVTKYIHRAGKAKVIEIVENREEVIEKSSEEHSNINVPVITKYMNKATISKIFPKQNKNVEKTTPIEAGTATIEKKAEITHVEVAPEPEPEPESVSVACDIEIAEQEKPRRRNEYEATIEESEKLRDFIVKNNITCVYSSSSDDDNLVRKLDLKKYNKNEKALFINVLNSRDLNNYNLHKGEKCVYWTRKLENKYISRYFKSLLDRIYTSDLELGKELAKNLRSEKIRVLE